MAAASVWPLPGPQSPASPGPSPSPLHTSVLSSQLGEGQLLLFRSEGCPLFEGVGGPVNETSSEINFGVTHASFACLGK